jgi:diaminopimelate decarboxylase
MDWLEYRNGVLHAHDVDLLQVSREYGTPCFVYSRPAIEQAYREFIEGIGQHRALVCYALKANPNLAVIQTLAALGAGFDIVSGGELARVIAAGGDPGKVVFSGVGKTPSELRMALEAGVRCFNVESESELHQLSQIAIALGKTAPVSLRVNPNVDAKTHPYISTGLRENKFGIPHEETVRLYRLAAGLPGLKVAGIDCHIGSQITQLEPFLAALDKILELIGQLAGAGIELHHVDLGGGLGIRYRDETPPHRTELMRAVFERIEAHPALSRMEVLFEFGRSIVGNAGILLTQVNVIKTNGSKRFAVVDAAMNDLMRPALYEAWHDVLEVTRQRHPAELYDVVGPVCESGDWLARERKLQIGQGDLLAFASAGAYGMSMSSNYNTRPRAAELMVDGHQCFVVRERESIEELFSRERLAPKRQ